MSLPDFTELDVAALRQRRGTKWSHYPADVLPAWVADMDFPAPEAVITVLRESVDGNDLGYGSDADRDEFVAAFADWSERRHAWRPEAARCLAVADVMQGVGLAIDRLSRPGDGVILQTPAYPPFFDAIGDSDRRLVANPLRDDHTIDAARLAAVVDDTTRILLLCNPHNPAGRVFTDAELRACAEVAVARDLVIVTDEIWADVVLPAHRHRSVRSVGAEAAARTVTITSASKAFGLPGLCAAVVHCGSDELHRILSTGPRAILGHPSPLGLRAMTAAWRHGERWLDAMVDQVRVNAGHVLERLAAEAPALRARAPEATYLLWVDCRALNLPVEPSTLALKLGRVALGRGPDYGPEGAGWVRLNLATSPAILDEVVDRFLASLSGAHA